jgi:hypothetical protein
MTTWQFIEKTVASWAHVMKHGALVFIATEGNHRLITENSLKIIIDGYTEWSYPSKN